MCVHARSLRPSVEYATGRTGIFIPAPGKNIFGLRINIALKTTEERQKLPLLVFLVSLPPVRNTPPFLLRQTKCCRLNELLGLQSFPARSLDLRTPNFLLTKKLITTLVPLLSWGAQIKKKKQRRLFVFFFKYKNLLDSIFRDSGPRSLRGQLENSRHHEAGHGNTVHFDGVQRIGNSGLHRSHFDQSRT